LYFVFKWCSCTHTPTNLHGNMNRWIFPLKFYVIGTWKEEIYEENGPNSCQSIIIFKPLDARLFWKNQPKMKIKKRNRGKMIRSNWHTYSPIIDKWFLGDSFHYACFLQDTRIISSCIHLNLLPIFCISIKIYKKILVSHQSTLRKSFLKMQSTPRNCLVHFLESILYPWIFLLKKGGIKFHLFLKGGRKIIPTYRCKILPIPKE